MGATTLGDTVEPLDDEEERINEKIEKNNGLV